MATETRETAGLIASDKVDGTNVYGMDGEKIASIESVMIGKTDGRVAYAILSFGGFLGIGDDHYPLPCQQLNYDTELGGYRVNLTKEQLENAPKYSGNWDWDDRERSRMVSDYYGAPWIGY
ncbi:MAG TPA: PRC-barrel domain-containing protein [Pseudolabrys sp.]|nr:PRC-barrel domain-containing protein [Pseudolabrys sp.]